MKSHAPKSKITDEAVRVSRTVYGLERLRETTDVEYAVSKSMRANRSRDTKPEVRLRKALWAAGMRGYRKNLASLPGKPDVTFGRTRLCVFLHGCFWHGCEKCKRNLSPSRNSAYWQAKIGKNKARDAEHAEKLRQLGYDVLTVWECDLAADINAVVTEITASLDAKKA